MQEGLHLGKEEVERKKASILEIEKTIASSYSAQTDAETKLKEDIALKEELAGKQEKNCPSG